MKRYATLFMATVLIAGFGFAKTKWDMHIAWPSGNFHTKGVVMFADMVAKKTGGDLEIVVHPGGALGFKGHGAAARQELRRGLEALSDR